MRPEKGQCVPNLVVDALDVLAGHARACRSFQRDKRRWKSAAYLHSKLSSVDSKPDELETLKGPRIRVELSGCVRAPDWIMKTVKTSAAGS